MNPNYRNPLNYVYVVGNLRQYCEAYHKRIANLEDQKFDLEKEVDFRDLQVLGRAAEINFF